MSEPVRRKVTELVCVPFDGTWGRTVSWALALECGHRVHDIEMETAPQAYVVCPKCTEKQNEGQFIAAWDACIKASQQDTAT